MLYIMCNVIGIAMISALVVSLWVKPKTRKISEYSVRLTVFNEELPSNAQVLWIKKGGK